MMSFGWRDTKDFEDIITVADQWLKGGSVYCDIMPQTDGDWIVNWLEGI